MSSSPTWSGRLQVPGRSGLSVMPQIQTACSGASWIARVVSAMLSAPSSRSLPMASAKRPSPAARCRCGWWRRPRQHLDRPPLRPQQQARGDDHQHRHRGRDTRLQEPAGPSVRIGPEALRTFRSTCYRTNRPTDNSGKEQRRRADHRFVVTTGIGLPLSEFGSLAGTRQVLGQRRALDSRAGLSWRGVRAAGAVSGRRVRTGRAARATAVTRAPGIRVQPVASTRA